MTFQLLVSCVAQDVHLLAEKMKIASGAIIINQKSEYAVEEFYATCGVDVTNDHLIRAFSSNEKGVGLSRNTALSHATADIILFADEDIVYDEGYENLVINEFEKNPNADIILFNVRVNEKRRTYWNEDNHPVHIWNAGRYPAYSIACKREKLKKTNVEFSLLFGGGAPFSNGEDSLFLKDALKAGLKLFAVTTCLGEEIEREGGESTWFKGYNEKFFYDRGVLYHYLYGNLAWLMQLRFLLKNKSTMCQQIPYKRASELMRLGRKKLTPYEEANH